MANINSSLSHATGSRHMIIVVLNNEKLICPGTRFIRGPTSCYSQRASSPPVEAGGSRGGVLHFFKTRFLFDP